MKMNKTAEECEWGNASREHVHSFCLGYVSKNKFVDTKVEKW